jgi:hypothetical protein
MSSLEKSDFLHVKDAVNKIADTEKSYYIGSVFEFPRLARFSDCGLSNAGTRMNFPSQFIRTVEEKHPDLAEEVLFSRVSDFFEKTYKRKTDSKLFIREFNDEVYGVLSDRYSVFDDKEVLGIVETSPYLMNSEEIWAHVSPEHLHLRFISKNKLYIDGDSSPLSMAVFVDNSMVGNSSLKIRFGIYRWACTNGLISGLKEFSILREVHSGEKNYSDILCEALREVPKYEQMMLKKVQEMSVTKSSIYDMTEEDAVRYIKDKLNIGKKNAQKIFTVYSSEYGGETKWDLCNAITFVARDLDITERLNYESRALKVA